MSSKYFNIIIRSKIPAFNKNLEVDSDKSISIRSFLIGALSQEISSAKNVLESEDVISSIKCLKILGVKITKIKTGNYLIYGNGLGSLAAKKKYKFKFWKFWNISKTSCRNIIDYTGNRDKFKR